MINFVSMGCRKLTYQYENEGLRKSETPLKKRVDYYPFGLTFNQQTRENTQAQNYLYTGKELQTDLDLNWTDYGARMYDAAIGRWNGIDPLSEQMASWSPYNYTYNNPINFTDPTGLSPDHIIVTLNEGDGTYTVTGGDASDGDTGVYLDDGKGGKGEKVGESLTTHSFFDSKNNAVVGAIIDTNSTEGQDFIDNEIIADDPNVFHYKDNATVNQDFDFKSKGLHKEASTEEVLKHRSRGSMTADGKMASARDFGNMGAGIVAARAGVPHWLAKKKFNDLQGGTEPPVSAKAQQIGLDKGSAIRKQDLIKSRFKKATQRFPTSNKF